MNGALRYQSQRGFTLLELLIAITLLSLLTTMLLAGFRVGTRHVERQTMRLERASQVPAAQAFLRAQLASAQPILDQTSTRKSIVFDGRPDGVDFVGVAPESLTIGGLQLFSVDFIRRADGQLRVRWQLFAVPESGAERSTYETVLLDGVAGLAFQYYGVVPPGKGPAWHRAWQGVEYLPSLIRLEAAFQDGQRMPDLTVAIRLAPVPRPE
jgi:general secretion pathway protein J